MTHAYLKDPCTFTIIIVQHPNSEEERIWKDSFQGYTEYMTSQESVPQYSSFKKVKKNVQLSLAKSKRIYLARLLGLFLELLDGPLVNTSALRSSD